MVEGGGGMMDDGSREWAVCLSAAGEEGLKGLKLGRCKNKTQGFGLEVKWPRLGIYSGRESHMGSMLCYDMCVAQVHAGRHHHMGAAHVCVLSRRRDRPRKK